MAISDKLLDELIGEAKSADNVFGKGGLIKELSKRLVERVLEEMREWRNRPLDKLYPIVFIDGFVGWRYFGITNKLDVAGQNVLDKTINVNDPFIGVRFRTVSEKWLNSLRFDVGGFGIGSEVSWKANLLIGYQFSELFSLYLGAQGYGIDYEKDNFGLDVVIGGIITGFNFHF